MTLFAADDAPAINAAASGAPRDAPAGCANRGKWYEGYDEAKRLMEKVAA
jgi:hypothetical protein